MSTSSVGNQVITSDDSTHTLGGGFQPGPPRGNEDSGPAGGSQDLTRPPAGAAGEGDRTDGGAEHNLDGGAEHNLNGEGTSPGDWRQSPGSTSSVAAEAQQGEGPAAASASSSAGGHGAPRTSAVSVTAGPFGVAAACDAGAVAVGAQGAAAASHTGVVAVGASGAGAAGTGANTSDVAVQQTSAAHGVSGSDAITGHQWAVRDDRAIANITTQILRAILDATSMQKGDPDA